jgi:hypothetical protein
MEQMAVVVCYEKLIPLKGLHWRNSVAVSELCLVDLRSKERPRLITLCHSTVEEVKSYHARA